MHLPSLASLAAGLLAAFPSGIRAREEMRGEGPNIIVIFTAIIALKSPYSKIKT